MNKLFLEIRQKEITFRINNALSVIIFVGLFMARDKAWIDATHASFSFFSIFIPY